MVDEGRRTNGSGGGVRLCLRAKKMSAIPTDWSFPVLVLAQGTYLGMYDSAGTLYIGTGMSPYVL